MIGWFILPSHHARTAAAQGAMYVLQVEQSRGVKQQMASVAPTASTHHHLGLRVSSCATGRAEELTAAEH